MSFAVNLTNNDGTVYVYYYDENAEYIGETVKDVGSGYNFANPGQGLFSWAGETSKAGNTLYNFLQKNPSYSNKGQLIGDKYVIPLKATTMVKYYDNKNNLLGTVAITVVVGQHYKVPKKLTFDGLTSKSVSKVDNFYDVGDKYGGVLGDYEIGHIKKVMAKHMSVFQENGRNIMKLYLQICKCIETKRRQC